MAARDAEVGGAREETYGSLRLRPLLDGLREAHPSVELTLRLDAVGVIPEPGLVERAVRDLVELACRAAAGPLRVEVETRDLDDAQAVGEELPFGRWVEVVVRDHGAGGGGHEARARIAGRLVASAPSDLRPRAVLAKSRAGTSVRFLVPAVR